MSSRNVLLQIMLAILFSSQFHRAYSFPSARSSKMKHAALSDMIPEQDLRKRGFNYILGSDESGNGCIAGPIVVCTCAILDNGNFEPIKSVDDSKKLSAEECRKIFNEIKENPQTYAWNVAIATNEEIDETDISTEIKKTLKKSVEDLVSNHNLPINESYSIVDGHKTPKLDIPLKCRPWKKGDSQVYTVALASIIAKCTHDDIILEMHEKYPNYGFIDNKGYPTRDHIDAIHEHGACPVHRMSSKPLKGR